MQTCNMNKHNSVFVVFILVLFYSILSMEVHLIERFSTLMKRDYKADGCHKVCDDLPVNDIEPVCMMYSRYKKGFQFFVNHCHARRVICKDNLILHMVHPNRCMKSNQFFLPIL